MTPVLAHARGHTTVTGVQRVVLRVVGHLVATHGADAIRGIAWHPKLRQAVEIDLSFLGPDYSFEANHAEFVRDMAIPYDAGEADRAPLRRLAAKLGRLRWRLGAASGFGRRLSRPTLTPSDRIFLPVPTLRNDPYIAFLTARKTAGNPVFQLIHDVIPVKLPELAKPGHEAEFRRFLDRVPDYVSVFLCVSDQTEADLREFLPAAGAAIPTRVTPLAHEFAGDAADDAAIGPVVRAIAETPFVLCVGTIEVRKNAYALVQAWDRLRPELGDRMPRLVLAGQRGWRTEDLFDLLSKTNNLGGTVAVAETPTDAELAFLYRHCLFTVFPSLYEGWGLPIGESLWFGKHCIASKTSSMPQVGGDLVDYVDPHDPDDLCQAMTKAIRQPDYVRTREGRIRDTARRRWAETARDVYSAVWDDMSAENPLDGLAAVFPSRG
ncbi:glycosyltransferase family 1 protein [Inquilinus sp. Marseille-Q2685]|uniref:glycosyltransferase family 4 protein n=1 Tax=Inquilinus sp. Marseille-Q2685 TaxID=2866581 RepID=UPI001CE3DC5D|nr:glycosyltransferase family 1 protein [Inquilinus sp. Marseille-Q2685]